MNVILFGFKSCGKTTLGKILAKRLNRPFYDTDELLERLYRDETGEDLPFREMYKRLGKETFRKLESDVVKELKGARDAIIAVGGGVILDPKNAALLAKLGQLVYLKVSKETLKKRILRGELPAFLDPTDPEGSFEKMLQERQGKYEKIPALTVDLEKKTQDQVVLELCAWIEQREINNG
jgi:shikimate kinase